MSDTLSPSAYFVVYVLAGLLVFLVGRELVCWYFKLNEIVSVLRQIRDRLVSIQVYGIGDDAAAKAAKIPPASPPQDKVAAMIERGIDGVRGLLARKPPPPPE